MQILCEGGIVFYDSEENPQANWKVLSRATIAFMVQSVGKFRVIKDRQRYLAVDSIVNVELVNDMVQEYLDFSNSTASLADLLTDGKGLSFLGASVRGDEEA